MATADLDFFRESRERYPRRKRKNSDDYGSTDEEGEEEAEEEEEEVEEQPPLASDEDICRVCRAGSLPERPLFHPCLCTGSIKFVHQDCLVQWLKHSGKEFCELCNHRFQFTPIYRPDMPQRLPITDIFGSISRGTIKNLRHWLHLAFVAFMWLVIVPICIYRIYHFLLYDSLWSIAKFPVQFFSLENLILDDIYGLIIVVITLVGFITLVWMKDQLMHGGGPAWLQRDNRAVNQLQAQETRRDINQLQQHLAVASERARARQQQPERVAIAAELADLHTLVSEQMDKIHALHREMFVNRRDYLRHREMELTYDLDMHHSQYMVLLKQARKKRYQRRSEWHAKEMADYIVRYKAENNLAEGEPVDLRKMDKLDPPSDDHFGLSKDEQAVIALYSRPRRQLTEAEREEGIRELEQLRSEQKVIHHKHLEYQRLVCIALSHPNKVEEKGHPLYGTAKEGDPEEGSEAAIAISKLTPLEQAAIRRIWELKRLVRDAQNRERVIITRQNREERERQNQAEVRSNRWYNRLLNRHQDNPLVLAERRRNRRPPRPNIGRALAGLARDRPRIQMDLDNQEDLSWTKLLGLDGSFRFLEHVVWMICLNSTLIVTFVYLPYQVGSLAAYLVSLWSFLGTERWKGIISTFIGYIIATVFILLFYYAAGKGKFLRARSFLGISYVSIKVGLILTVEAGIFPLMCGWWIDICSFALFGSTMKNRHDSLERAPGTVMFLHWLAGMIFIFYLASFVMLLREVLRPGVLWFLRNLNDNNFHPIHEMIGLPLQRHLRRFVMSCIMFGVCVFLVLYLPSQLIPLLFKNFLPYNLTLSSSISPIREVQLELILLQFVIPTLLEHGNCRTGLKFLIGHWAKIAAKIFGLQSYLLDQGQTGGDVVDLHGNVIASIPASPIEEEGPVHTGPLQVLGPGFPPYKPYLRPPYFYLRIGSFLVFTTITSILFSCVLITAPVAVGRLLMGLVGMTNPPELYTAAIGLYMLWLVIRFGSSVYNYVTLGFQTLFRQSGIWTVQAVKCLLAGVLLFVVIPLLLGHLVDLLILTPLRVPSNRTPIFYPSTEWALGLLHTKCVCGAIWLTDMDFKRTLDQVYQAGVRNLNLTFIVKEVAWPVILGLSLCITVPYVLFMGVLPSFDVVTYQTALLLYRYFFPCVLIFLVSLFLIVFVFNSLRRLYNHIRNEKYLIGRQLVNYSGSLSPLPDDAEEEELEEREDEVLGTPIQETGEQ